jgi:diguanylate cyclase
LTTGFDPKACGRLAYGSLERLGIVPSPDNFAIWYEYHSGLNPELRHLVDTLQSHARRFDEQMMAAIHRKFMAHAREREAVQQASARMLGMLQEVGSMVGEAGANADRFGAAVRDSSSAFVAGGLGLPELIQRVQAEARDMAARSETLARHLDGAAERIHALERSLDDVRRDAQTDGLTGLHNRRAFDARLRALAGEAMNSGAPLCLLLADVDHFKKVNDTWGHPIGDQVLRLVATVMRQAMRDDDFVARYGGEEFAAVLPGTAPDSARAAAERLRQGFEGRHLVVRNSGQTIGGVTLSVGGACYDPGEPLVDWLGRADAALYAAKRAGRNRVHMAAAAHASDPAPIPVS